MVFLRTVTIFLLIMPAFLIALVTGIGHAQSKEKPEGLDGTITISGYVTNGGSPELNVTLKAMRYVYPNNVLITQTITQNPSGFYSLEIPSDIGSFWVTATKDGRVFEPLIRYYDTLSGTQFNQNYIVKLFNESLALPGLKYSSVDWGDFNNDGKLDLVVSGATQNNVRICKVYRNTSSNISTSFEFYADLPSFNAGKIVWIDYNNDGDLDLLATGNYGTGDYARLFKNYNGFFYEQDVNAFETPHGMINSTLAIGDFNHDGWTDMVVAGERGNGVQAKDKYIVKVFKNVRGQFQWHSDLLKEVGIHCGGLADASLAFGDFDVDGDLDLAATGRHNYYWINGAIGQWSYTDTTKVFNYVSSTDSFIPSNTLPGVSGGSIAWTDVNNDGHLDLVVAGDNKNNNGGNILGKIFRVYKNTLNYTWALYADLSSSFGVADASLDVGDYNNDGRADLAVQGRTNVNNKRICKVLRNTGSGFQDIQANLPGVGFGTLAWGDYNNDGKLDLASTGMLDSTGLVCNVYKNYDLNANTSPLPPTEFYHLVNSTNGDVKFQWNKGTDTQTPSGGLTYNICVGSTSNTCDVVAPMVVSNTNSKRTVAAPGSIVKKAEMMNYWILSGLASGRYWWRVQTIDTGFMSSSFNNPKMFDYVKPGKK